MTKYHRHIHTSSRKKAPKLIDKIIYIAAVLEPALVIPQILRIFSTREADGVSLSTWVGFEVMTAIWLWYSAEHKQKMVFLYSVLFFIVQGLVIIGGLIYGAKW